MKNRPFIFLCTGMSLDGKIAGRHKKQTEIAPNDDKEMLYEGRVRADAVMIGGNTLLQDDPGLTVKSAKRQKERLKKGKSKEPIKVAIISNVSKLKTSGDFFNKGKAEKIIFTTKKSPARKVQALQKICRVYVCGDKQVNLKKVVAKLHNIGIKSLMIEGGGELIYSMFKNNLVDEINLKIGNLIIGGRDATTLCDGAGFLPKDTKKVKLVSVLQKKNYLILKYSVIK